MNWAERRSIYENNQKTGSNTTVSSSDQWAERRKKYNSGDIITPEQRMTQERVQRQQQQYLTQKAEYDKQQGEYNRLLGLDLEKTKNQKEEIETNIKDLAKQRRALLGEFNRLSSGNNAGANREKLDEIRKQLADINNELASSEKQGKKTINDYKKASAYQKEAETADIVNRVKNDSGASATAKIGVKNYEDFVAGKTENSDFMKWLYDTSAAKLWVPSWDKYTDEEKAVYGYLRETNEEKANEYMLETNKRHENEERQKIKSNISEWSGSNFGTAVLASAGSILTNVGAPLDYIQRMADAGATEKVYGKAHIMPTIGFSDVAGAMQSGVAEKIEENTNFEFLGSNVAAQLYGIGMSAINSAALIAAMGPFATIEMSMQAAASATMEKIDEGLSDSQAIKYGTAAGVAEGLFEYLSIDKLLKPKNVVTIKQGLKEFLAQAGVEASEEAFTTLANTISDIVINGDQSELRQSVAKYIEEGKSQKEAEWQAFLDWGGSLLWDAIGGFVSGGLLGGAKTVIDTVSSKANGNMMESQIASSLVSDIDESEVQKRAARYEKKGMSTEEATQKAREDIQNKKAKEYTERGMSAEEAAEAVKADDIATGERNKKLREEILDRGLNAEEGSKANTAAKAIQEKLKSGESVSADEWKNLIKSTRAQVSLAETKDAIKKAAQKSGESLADTDVDVMAAAMEKNFQGKNMSEAENKLIKGSEAAKKAYSELTGLNYETGEVIPEIVEEKKKAVIRDILGEQVADYAGENRSNGYKNALSKTYRAYLSLVEEANAGDIAQLQAKLSPEGYAQLFSEFYEFGKSGEYSADVLKADLEKRGAVRGEALKAFETAYELGRSEAKSSGIKNAKVRQAELNEQKRAKSEKKATAPKGVARSITEKELKTDAAKNAGAKAIDMKRHFSQKQRSAIAFAREFAKMTDINIVFYQTEDGKGANGWYDRETDTIYIDLFSGLSKQSGNNQAMLRTLSHELTHFMEKYSPEHYEEYKQFLLEYYYNKDNGETLSRLVEQEKRLAPNQSAEYWQNEIVANASEMFINDESAMRALISEHADVAQTVDNWFKKMNYALRRAFKGVVTSGSAEADAAKELQANVEAFSEAQKRWSALLKESVEAKKAVGAAEESGDVKFSMRVDSDYMKAVESGDTETVQKLVDEAARAAGYNIKAYHGTARADRVGTVFRPERATSGPMAFFTDSRDIASNYARDKADTSLAYDEEYSDYYTQFRVNRNGKSLSVGELWNKLSPMERMKIKNAAPHIRFDENLDNIIYDPTAMHGNGAYDVYELNYNKGNVLNTLISTWLDSGDLYDREADFLDVLKLAGVADAEYRDPNARYEKVYNTYLKIQHPFDTSSIGQVFYDELALWLENTDISAYQKKSADADMWDKNSIDPELFLERLSNDIEAGTSHVWTSIPDYVTAYLKEQGYDGIKDTGGKNGGEIHTVWIPFYSEQIKSADAVTYDDKGNVIPLSERFNAKNDDIRYSMRGENWKPTLDKVEWRIVNYAIENKTGKELTETTDYFFRKEKGKTVFGIYSTDDSTLLYAVHGERAYKEYNSVKDFKEEIENAAYSGAKRSNTWDETARVRYGTNAVNRDSALASGRYSGNDPLYGKQHGSDASRALQNVLKNIFSERQTDGSRGSGESGGSRGLTVSDLGKIQYQLRIEDKNRLDILDKQETRLTADLKTLEKAYAEAIRAEYERSIKPGEETSRRAAEINRKAAKRYMNEVGATFHVPKDERSLYLLPIINDIIDKGPTISESEGLIEQLYREAYRHSQEYVADDGGLYKKERDALRDTAIYVDPGTRSDVGDYERFRKNNMGSLKLTSDPSAISLDGLYDMLANNYPDFFSGSTDGAEQLYELSAFMKNKGMVESIGDYMTEDEFVKWAMNGDSGLDTELDNLFDKTVGSFLSEASRKERERANAAKVNRAAENINNAIKNYNKSLDAARAEGVLAGQMNQGAKDAAELRRVKERFANKEDAYINELRERRAQMVEERKAAAKVNRAAQDYARAEGVLAGQMAQGAKDAAKLRVTAESYENRIKAYRNKLSEVREKRDAALKARREAFENYKAERADSARREVLRKRIAKGVRSLNTMLLNPTDNKHIPQDLRGAVAGFLSNFTDNSSVFSKSKLDALAKAYSQIAEESSDLNDLYDPDIKDYLDKMEKTVEGKRLSELSADELELVNDVTNYFTHIVRDGNKLLVDGRRQNISELASETVRAAENHGYKTYRGGTLGGAVNWADKYLNYDNITPYYFFNRMGGGMKRLYNDMLYNSQLKYSQDINEDQKFMASVYEKYHVWDWSSANQKNKNDILRFETARKGAWLEMTRNEVLAAYATYKRGKALGDGAAHMKEGGIVVKSKTPEKFMQEYVKSSKGVQLDIADIQKMFRFLTDEQKACADAVVNYLTTVEGARRNETSMALYGYKKFNETYYFPYRVASDYTKSHAGQEVSPDGTKQAGGSKMLKNMGSAKALTPNANAAIVIDDFFKVVAESMNDTARYHAFAVQQDNFMRVLNYKDTVDAEHGSTSVKQAIRDSYGTEGINYITGLMGDSFGGAVQLNDDNVFGKLFGKFKKTAVAANLSVAIQQPSAIMRATAMIDGKYLTKTVRQKNALEEMYEYSSTAFLKNMGRFDIGTGRSAEQYILKPELKGKDYMRQLFATGEYSTGELDDVTGFLSEKADWVTWGHIMNAVMAEIEDTTDLKRGTEEFKRAAGRRFDEVVNATQVYDSVLVKSPMMRDQRGIAQIISAFKTEPTLSYNLFVDSISKEKVAAKSAARGLLALALNVFANALLKSIIGALRDRDEDKTYLEKYAEKLANNIGSDLIPILNLPGVDAISEAIQGFTTELPEMGMISDSVSAVDKALKKIIKGDWGGALGELTVVFNLFGLPVRNVYRDFAAIFNTAVNTKPLKDTSFAGIYEAAVDGFLDSSTIYGAGKALGLIDTSKAAGIKKAMRKGDSIEIRKATNKLIKEYVASGKSENEAKGYIKGALTNYWKPLYQNANSAERAKIRKALYATGIYENTDAVVKMCDNWLKDD